MNLNELAREDFALRQMRRAFFRRFAAAEAPVRGSSEEALLLRHLIDADDLAYAGAWLMAMRWISREPRWLQPWLVKMFDRLIS